MSKTRGKAFRRWKTFTKYVARMKERMDWHVPDPNTPKGYRHPKDWKELDNSDNNAEVKMLKKTSTKWSSKWEDSNDHIRIKKMRQEGKNEIDEQLE